MAGGMGVNSGKKGKTEAPDRAATASGSVVLASIGLSRAFRLP